MTASLTLKPYNENGINNLQNIFDMIYPVGSIYMSTASISPAQLFGFGEWEQIKDTFLLAAGDNHALSSQGGEETHTLTISEMPSHTHAGSSDLAGAHAHSRGGQDIVGILTRWQGDANNANLGSGAFSTDYGAGKYFGSSSSVTAPISTKFVASRNWTGVSSTNGAHTHTITNSNTGGGSAHNNMPPYLAVNVWKRVA